MGSPRLALVGTFVAGGLLLFAVGLFLIGDRRLLFTEHFEVEADFGNVTGIVVGTSVRLAGLDAGEVLGLEIPSRPVSWNLRQSFANLLNIDDRSSRRFFFVFANILSIPTEVSKINLQKLSLPLTKSLPKLLSIGGCLISIL